MVFLQICGPNDIFVENLVKIRSKWYLEGKLILEKRTYFHILHHFVVSISGKCPDSTLVLRARLPFRAALDDYRGIVLIL